MRHFRLTPDAKADLRQVIQFIARDSVNAALTVRDRFDDAFQTIARQPGIGHFRADILPETYRFYNVHSYHIIYRWQNKPVQIIAIVHSSRDLQVLFAKRLGN